MQSKVVQIKKRLKSATKKADILQLKNELIWEMYDTDVDTNIKESLSILKNGVHLKNELLKADACKNLARLYFFKQNYQESCRYGFDALNGYRLLKDKTQQADSLILLAMASSMYGDYDNALSYSFLSLDICDEIKYWSGIAKNRSVIGNCYISIRDYENALINFQRGLAVLKKIPSNEVETPRINILINLGFIYLKKKEYKSVTSLFNKYVPEKSAVKNKLGLIYVYNIIAEANVMLNNNNEALTYAKKALRIADEKQNITGQADALYIIGKAYYQQKSINNGIDSLLAAFKLLKNNTLSDTLPNVFKLLSTIYADQNDFKTALEYHKKYYQAKKIRYRNELKKKHENLLVLHQVQSLKKETAHYKETTNALRKLNEEVGKKRKDITESIAYAKHIQESILSPELRLKQYFSDSFVLLKPKDIVSGDFFWIHENENELFVAAVDCTGHGVPGAFMSIVANSMLNQIVASHKKISPALILNEVNHFVERTLTVSDDTGIRDSMDISLIAIDKNNNTVLFSGANQILYVVSDKKIKEYRGEDISIGNNNAAKFTNQTIDLNEGDCLYLFSDGFPDQKGGLENRKFYYEPIKKLLIKNYNLPMQKQKKVLDNTIQKWMGNNSQIDDILFIGIRI